MTTDPKLDAEIDRRYNEGGITMHQLAVQLTEETGDDWTVDKVRCARERVERERANGGEQRSIWLNPHSKAPYHETRAYGESQGPIDVDFRPEGVMEFPQSASNEYYPPEPRPQYAAPAPSIALPDLVGNPRYVVVDIETTDFKAEGYKGHLVCACLLPLDTGKVETYALEIEDRGHDLRLLKSICRALWPFDVLIGHNITAFDMAWLDSRRDYYGLPPLRAWLLYDTYQMAKVRSLKVRKKLDTLCSFYHIRPQESKTSIVESEWHDVRSPFPQEFYPAIHNITKHCEIDVRLNLALYNRVYGSTFEQGGAIYPKMTKWRTGRAMQEEYK